MLPLIGFCTLVAFVFQRFCRVATRMNCLNVCKLRSSRNLLWRLGTFDLGALRSLTGILLTWKLLRLQKLRRLRIFEFYRNRWRSSSSISGFGFFAGFYLIFTELLLLRFFLRRIPFYPQFQRRNYHLINRTFLNPKLFEFPW
jgi:hypothetical protein